MRTKIIAGNWKMNTDLFEGMKLVSEVIHMVADEVTDPHIRIVLAPPFTHLYPVGQLLKDEKRIFLSAQNCASEEKGAFTGEVSAAMVRSVGASYVLIGHSERRTLFGETDLTLKKKVDRALKQELIPIFCCGETLPQREGGHHFEVVEAQLSSALSHLGASSIQRTIIAYEPVWAIGTGVNATAAQAQEMHAFIRNSLGARYGEESAAQISILYGGSCSPANAKEIFSCRDVDGGLIGGASLKSRDFVDVIKAAS